MKEFKFKDEDDLLTKNFETGSDDNLEAILGADFIRMVTILPAKFGDAKGLTDCEEDCFDVFPR